MRALVLTIASLCCRRRAANPRPTTMGTCSNPRTRAVAGTAAPARSRGRVPRGPCRNQHVRPLLRAVRRNARLQTGVHLRQAHRLGVERLPADQYHGLDAPQSAVRSARVVVLSIITVVQPRFRSAIQFPGFGALYAGATGVQSTTPLRIAGDPPTDISSRTLGGYLYTLGWTTAHRGGLQPSLLEFRVTAGAVTLLRSYGDPPLSAKSDELRPRPNTLNLQSMGRWWTQRWNHDLPATPEEIDIASIRLNGIVPVDPSGTELHWRCGQ